MSRLLCAKTVCETAQEKKKKTVKNIRKKSVRSLFEMPPCGLIKTALREAFFPLLSEGHHLLCFTQLNRICRRKQRMKACRSPSRVCVCVHVQLSPLFVCERASLSIHPSPSASSLSRSASLAQLEQQPQITEPRSVFSPPSPFPVARFTQFSDNTARPINENHTIARIQRILR